MSWGSVGGSLGVTCVFVVGVDDGSPLAVTVVGTRGEQEWRCVTANVGLYKYESWGKGEFSLMSDVAESASLVENTGVRGAGRGASCWMAGVEGTGQ